MTASHTGAVASHGTPSPVSLTLNSGQSKNVTVAYTTGSAGTGAVVLKASGGSPTISTSATLSVTVSGQQVGIPFGVFELFTSASQTQTDSTIKWFNLSMDGITPPYLATRIKAARDKGLKLITNMTGGPHAQYMDTIGGVFQFSMAKWKTAMKQRPAHASAGLRVFVQEAASGRALRFACETFHKRIG